MCIRDSSWRQFALFSFPKSAQQAEDEVFAVGFDEKGDPVDLGPLDQQITDTDLNGRVNVQFRLLDGHQRG